MSSSAPTSRSSCRSWGSLRSATARSTPGGTISTSTSSPAGWAKAEPAGPMFEHARGYGCTHQLESAPPPERQLLPLKALRPVSEDACHLGGRSDDPCCHNLMTRGLG